MRGGGGAFRHLVYIALKKGSRNLHLEGFSDTDSNDYSSEGESDVDASEGEKGDPVYQHSLSTAHITDHVRRERSAPQRTSDKSVPLGL